MSPSNQQASVRLTGVSALLHFLVDGLCICCLYLATVGKMDIVTTYVTYNVLAFLTQPLTGWWADWMRQRHWMLLGSVLLLTLGVAACQLSTINEQFIMPTAVLLGIGNSLFHVWGGKQVAVNTGNDIRALGVFVSTGAFGLAVGGVLASWSLLYVFLLSICVLAIQTLQAQTLPSPSLQGGSSISINEKTSEQGNHPLPVGRVTCSLWQDALLQVRHSRRASRKMPCSSCCWEPPRWLERWLADGLPKAWGYGKPCC